MIHDFQNSVRSRDSSVDLWGQLGSVASRLDLKVREGHLQVFETINHGCGPRKPVGCVLTSVHLVCAKLLRPEPGPESKSPVLTLAFEGRGGKE